MNDLLLYLGKVSAGLAIIILPYYFLLRKDSNLQLKRLYLLAGIWASWIFPFISFRKPALNLDLTPTVFLDLNEASSPALQLDPSLGTDTLPAGLSINWLKILLIVYLAGLMFMLLKNLTVLWKWNRSWKQNHIGQGVSFSGNDQVFTIFTRIFIPASLQDKDDCTNILLHERAHIRQFHYIDLILMELTLLLTWFNPFSWLISRMMKENHEHLADRQVLSTGVDPARYRAQLMNHTLGVNVFRLGTPFNHSLTLNRFKMMKKPSRSPFGIIKFALLIPLVIFSLGMSLGTSPQQKTIKGKVVFADTGNPATGASVVVRNSTLGCVVDQEGLFMLNVDGDPELVISFVGYKSLIVKASEIGKTPLKLELDTYDLDLKQLTLEEAEDAREIEDLEDAREAEEVREVEVVREAEEDGKNAFYVVEEMPTFNGGDPVREFRKYIASNLRYPKSAAEKGKDGRVIVQFMVNTNGDVVNPVVVRGADPALDKEALRVVSTSPKWTPGKEKGKPVNVLFTFPINFVLQNPSGAEAEKAVLRLKDQNGTMVLDIKDQDGREKNPVFVVDGKKTVDGIENLNPDLIEQITVLKDPNDPMVKKYKATDGLILITTKDGEGTDNHFISKTEYVSFDQNKKESTEKDGEVFFIVEDVPHFPGGKTALKSYIYQHLKYPTHAKQKGIEGEVQVKWLVDTDGKVKNAEVVRSSYQGFDEAALRVIREMPDWKPGSQRGKAVPVYMTTSIAFELPEK